MSRIVKTCRLMATATLALCVSAPSTAKDKPPIDYGPAPEWHRYKELSEAAVRAKLPDPDNWSVQWNYGYMKTEWDHKGRFPGYLTCGRLIARTPPPKGKSVVNFIAVVAYDHVRTIDISKRESNSLINIACANMVSYGQLPPAHLMEQQATQRTLAGLGATIRIVPEGAQITEVTAGSPASRAGLTSGVTISHANGIALAGLGPAIATILESDAPALQLRTTSGATFEVKRAP